jgi:hypothetical protein
MRTHVVVLFCSLFLVCQVSSPAFGQDGVLSRPSVAITRIDRTSAIPSWFDESAFRAMLESAIVSTDKFRLVERAQADVIADERELVEAGKVRAGGVSNKVDGVGYLIYGRVVQFNFAGVPKGEPGLVSSFGSIFVGESPEKPQPFTFSVELKITDLKTGAIRYTGSVTQTRTAQRVKNKSPLALPVIVDIQKSVADLVARELSFTIFPIRVVEARDGLVTLNYGSGMLTRGEVLKIYSQGAPIVDPYTKETLGTAETMVAEAVVQESKARVTVAKIRKRNSAAIEVGAIARVAQENSEK